MCFWCGPSYTKGFIWLSDLSHTHDLESTVPAKWVEACAAFIKRSRGSTCIEDKPFQPSDPTHLICSHDLVCICCFLKSWKAGGILRDQLWVLDSSTDHFTLRLAIKLFIIGGMAFMPWFAVSSGEKPIQWQALSLWPSSKQDSERSKLPLWGSDPSISAFAPTS